MANYPFILICFVLVLHNLVLVVFSADQGIGYQPICPNSFQCQSLGNLSFPFYTFNNSACGLCMLNCNEAVPEIFLGKDGPSYELLQVMPGGANLRLRDTSFLNEIDNQSCSAFTERSPPNSPSISYTISPNFTFLRCPKSPGLGDQIDEYFQEAGEYYQYNTCNDYNYYYTYSRGYISASVNPLPRCSVIVLPAVSPSMLPGNTNFTNPFVLLRPEFDLVLQVSSSCQECYRSGGQCLNDNQEFRCLYNSRNTTKDNPRDLVIKSALATIGIGTAIILVILVFCFRFKIVSRFKTDASINMETFIKNHEALAPKRYSYSQVKKMTDSFKVKLGQGGYGSVYRGTLFNGNPVAVKVLDELKGNGEDFVNELASISKTSHVNIVGLLGFCFESRHRALIYEYMPNGSLEKFISSRSSVTNGQLEWEKLYEIAVGIARGLEYLHIGCNTRIVHLDIKPHNILLDQEFCPKISDFGLAKLCPEKRSVISLSGMRGTPGYIAPEVFSRHFGEVSHKSDVYSYGMMVLEMVGGQKNLVNGIDHTSNSHFPQWIYKQLASNENLELSGIVNEKENKRVKKMIIVSLWCIQSDPSSRPSMTKVLEMLEGSLEFLQIPPKPFLFSPPISPYSNI